MNQLIAAPALPAILIRLVSSSKAYTSTGLSSSAAVSSSRIELVDRLQLALNHPRACADELIEFFIRLIQPLLGHRQYVVELIKFCFHRTQDRPDLAAALLDRQRSEAHLQTVEQRCHRAWSGDVDAVIPLQRFD